MEKADKNIPENLAKHLAIYEKQIIINALEDNSWNQTQTADFLGVSRKTLYNKMKKYNIK